MMKWMSEYVARVSCPAEAVGADSARPIRPVRQAPACDFLEKAIWEQMGGGWECLHGCYCQHGLSVEWHDFKGLRPREWSRSFHPDSLEICLNLSGIGRITHGADTLMFRPMTWGFYALGNDQGSAWRLPGEPHVFLTVELSRGFLERHLKGHELMLHPVVRTALRLEGRGPRLSRAEPLTVLRRRSLEVWRQPPVPAAARALYYQGKALALVSEMLFLPAESEGVLATRNRSVAGKRVDRVTEILGRRLDEPPSLKELGREVGCSPYHLSRTFSQVMGMTIPRYVRQVRMERAAELLRSGRYNVTEAAMEVGYSSLSHFSQAFCETMGCCPGLYPMAPRRGAGGGKA